MTQDAIPQDVLREQIGSALRLLRQERGWTQRRLARQCSSRSSLAAYEAGQSEPQVTTLLEILEALGYGLTDFARVLDRLQGKDGEIEETGEKNPDAEIKVRRRAFMLVDLSEEEVPHGLEQDLKEWEELIERLTAFTYRYGAADASKRRKAPQEAEDEAFDEQTTLKKQRKAL